ncbi:MAG: DUF934 domain-containing protein [Gammaproteobacteria bacterium]|nr:DUF934 domain-containing protein [Gammaproteobacteria bacterium]
MLIIKGADVTEDEWTRLPEGQAPTDDSAEQPLLVGLADWLLHRDVLLARAGRLGVLLCGEDEVERLIPDLDHLQLIAVSFPVFTDGRGYSQARLLRDRFNYAGELRAVGEVLPDQADLMSKVGIDSFSISDSVDSRRFFGLAG